MSSTNSMAFKIIENGALARSRMEQHQGKTAKKVTYFDNVLSDGAAYFNVPLEVNVQKFENKIEFLVGMNDVQKPGIDP